MNSITDLLIFLFHSYENAHEGILEDSAPINPSQSIPKRGNKAMMQPDATCCASKINILTLVPKSFSPDTVIKEKQPIARGGKVWE